MLTRKPRPSWVMSRETDFVRFAPGFIIIRSMSDPLIIAGRHLRSRLIVGTGKYKSFQETARALEASGADVVTVAVRRVTRERQGHLARLPRPEKICSPPQSRRLLPRR